jgi:hypothetical protein
MLTRLRTLLFAAAVIAGPVVSLPALAQPEFYLGAGYGRYDIDEDRFDEEDTVWKAYAGFSFNQALGVELSWVDFNEAREAGTSLDTDGWGAAAVLSLPLSENFALYGKAGQFFWETDASGLGPGVRIDRDGDDPFFGAGAKFRLNDLLDLRLEWERYDVAEADLDTLFVMLQASF